MQVQHTVYVPSITQMFHSPSLLPKYSTVITKPHQTALHKYSTVQHILTVWWWALGCGRSWGAGVGEVQPPVPAPHSSLSTRFVHSPLDPPHPGCGPDPARGLTEGAGCRYRGRGRRGRGAGGGRSEALPPPASSVSGKGANVYPKRYPIATPSTQRCSRPPRHHNPGPTVPSGLLTVVSQVWVWDQVWKGCGQVWERGQV